MLESCKSTLAESLQLEDYEEEGVLPAEIIKECFSTLEIEISEELMEYVMHAIYSRSESQDRMKYQVLIDLAEGKFAAG